MSSQLAFFVQWLQDTITAVVTRELGYGHKIVIRNDVSCVLVGLSHSCIAEPHTFPPDGPNPDVIVSDDEDDADR
jgi:hypothetical protein